MHTQRSSTGFGKSRLSSRLTKLVLFHISNLDFFHRSEPRPRGD